LTIVSEKEEIQPKGGDAAMQCNKCSRGDPVGEAHYHIIVENGKVTAVWYLSANGYWDRDLEKDEYFVEYRKDPRFGRSVKEDWLEPRLYKGSKARK
jgi:hypothetical protein